MAKKKTEETKKPKAEFGKYITLGIAPVIIRHIPKIKEICQKFEGIGEMDSNSWTFLAKVLVECSTEAEKYIGEDGGYLTLHKEVMRRANPYTLAHKVREMMTKKFAYEHIFDFEQETTDDRRIYKAYMVYCQFNVMMSENCYVPRKKKESMD